MSLSPWPFLFRSGISMAATTSLLRVRYGATVTAIADEKMLDVVVIVWFCFFVWPDQGVSVLSGVHVHARKRHPSPTLSTASTTSSTSATSEGRKSQQHGPKFGASSFWVFLLDCTRFTPRFLLTINPPPPPLPQWKNFTTSLARSVYRVLPDLSFVDCLIDWLVRRGEPAIGAEDAGAVGAVQDAAVPAAVAHRRLVAGVGAAAARRRRRPRRRRRRRRPDARH